MIKSKLPVVYEHDLYYNGENEDTKCQTFLSPLPKNRYENSENKQKPRRSTLGLSNFQLNIDGSPMNDRYIPRRCKQDSNIALYEINHNDSPPINLNKDDFDNSLDFEEKK
jgi:hypothetical protein